VIVRDLLQQCRICPRECGVNRYSAVGFCNAKAELRVNLTQLHFGEEPPISGTQGSGTVFFAYCNLLCEYCQNSVISFEGNGTNISEEALVEMFFELEAAGAHNINLVTPTHYSLQLIGVIRKAKNLGLQIPVLWNSSAYEKIETLKTLDGLIDIYLPDYKYYHSLYAKKYSHAANYPEIAFGAIREMHRQKGKLQLDADGIAQSGVLIRLLVLPHGLAGAKQSLLKIFDEFGPEMALSIMAQYYPAGNAHHYPELNRGIYAQEYQEVLAVATDLGFSNVYIQQLSCSDLWTPKFRVNKELKLPRYAARN